MHEQSFNLCRAMSESVSTLGSGSAILNGRPKIPKVLIACSGSVATLKVPELVAELVPHFEVMVILTSSASFFLEKAQEYNESAWKKFEAAGGWNLVLKDEDEWQMWNAIGNSVLHIEMRRWADILVVAPASANLLSKAAYGIADNFVLSVMRAWDFRKPCVLCPAMNTAMWTHPSTKDSIDRMESWGWEVLGPVEKLLACNEKGNGAMISVQEIKAFLLAKWVKKAGAAHALTNANLQLHGMLLSSGLSQSTAAESADIRLNTTGATADLFGRDSRRNTSETLKKHTQDPNLKTALTSAKPGTPTKAKSAPVAQTSTATATAAAVGLADKPVLAKGSPAATPVAPTSSSSAVATPSAGSKLRDVVLQSFVLGVGIGVGLVATNLVMAFFTGSGVAGSGSGTGAQTSKSVLEVRPGGLHRVSI